MAWTGEPSHRETSLIPDWSSTIAAFLAACAFFTALGLPLARAVAPRHVPPLALAPTLGWAAYAGIGLPVLSATGFSAFTATLFSIVAAAASGLLARLQAGKTLQDGSRACIGPGFLLLAGTLALLPLTAIMPKHVASGILLAPPLFDHVKIAVVDGILRDGLPVPNPFIGPGTPGHLAYYYLWHVGTAMLASAMHVGGWAAEAAMTGFTAYASLVLVMGVVVGLGGSRSGSTSRILCSMMLILPGSMRPILGAVLGADALRGLIPGDADIGAWLNQAAWVPQHLASACCVIVSALLMVRMAEGVSVLVAAALGLCVAAGFESSIWVGGIAFAAAGAAWGMLLLAQSDPALRRRLVLLASGAATLAAGLILPLVLAELHAVRARDAGGGIGFLPYRTFGAVVPHPWGRLADLPAFWLVLLPFSIPAVMPIGVAWLWLSRRRLALDRSLQGCSVVAVACLAIAWLFRSTIDNNDLGWRAALPAILLLAAFAGCALGTLLEGRRWRLAALVLAIAALGVPDAARMTRTYALGQFPGDAAGLARSQRLWDAVRRHAGPDDRIANNPLAVALATPWPVNIAWATLSDRPSCYAGWATAIAYADLPRPALMRMKELAQRVFGGHAEAGDVATLAGAQNCAFAVVTPEDGAWTQDPFAVSKDFVLVESSAGWRIYGRKKAVLF